MKQTNKLLSVLLALCLITGLLPWTVLPARADGDGTADSPWQIGTTGHESEVTAVLAGGVLTVSGSGDMADFEQVFSGGVLSTTAPWYAQNASITAIAIGDDVTSVGAEAFDGCKNLTTLALGGVTTVGAHAFSRCENLTTLDLSGVTTLKSFAFNWCTGLTTLALGGVTTIGNDAFHHCTGLETIDLGQVQSIEAGAFSECTGLTSVTIPASVTEILGNPFPECESLTSLSVAEGNTAYRIDENGFLLSADGKTLLYCPNGKTGALTIPAGVETVGHSAFRDRSGLTGTLVIPADVTTIGDFAFYGCSGLTGPLTVPDSVTSIGGDAFYYCTGITDVTVGSGVATIGGGAFTGCSALQTLRIEGDGAARSIEFFGGSFSGGYNLETVTFGNGVGMLRGGTFASTGNIKTIVLSTTTDVYYGALGETGNSTVVYYYGGKDYSAPINSWGVNLSNVKPYRILTVADSVANGTVTASGTTTPEDLAAKNCFLPGDTLTLTLTPDDGCSVDSVSYNDGSDHTLTPADGVCSFTMPGDADVTVSAVFTANANPEAAIGDTEYATLQAAFAAASDGDTVTLLRDVEQKTTLDLSKAASLSLDLNGRKLLFNSGLETNFKYFIYDDSGHMVTITGSGTIEAKGLNASGNATIPLWRFCHDGDADTGTGTLTILDDAAMKNIKNTGDCPWAAFTNSITEAALEEGVTKIGVVTFCACENLKTITLPATVTSINEDSSGLLPFDRCPKLEKIMVADGNTVYSNNNGDGVLYTKDKKTLIFCPRGKTGTLTVPAEVTTLKKYSFNNDDSRDNSTMSTMSLRRIEFARTEPGTLSTDKAFDSYTGKCVLVASDGMLIDNQRQAPATDYTTGTTISFRAVTRWDELQEALNKGGTVTLTRSYDYTKDSYEINGWGIISYYGKLNVPKGTVLDLNGYTLAAVEFCGDGEFTVKGGTLNCMRLTNNATMVDPANATYGTLTLDDATVTADQLLWFGGMALMESTLTVGESEEGAGNNGKNINVTWVQPESGAMLTMDTASSVTLPQQQETDGQWRLTDFQTSEDAAAAAGQLGTYLPRGWTFETITGTRNYGSSEQPYYVPYYALAVKDAAGAYPTSVTLRNYFSVQDGKVTAPEGAVLIVAEYEASGRMTSVRSVSAPADGWVGVPIADIASGAGFTLPSTYKLFLVNGETYAPLCEAWEKKA